MSHVVSVTPIDTTTIHKISEPGKANLEPLNTNLSASTSA